jgi:hypothetical protein
VLRYDFNWPIGYDVASPMKPPKGTKLRVDAHFDSSPAKRANLDPSSDVYGGTQSWEEMMNPFLGVVVDRQVDPKRVLSLRGARGGG